MKLHGMICRASALFLALILFCTTVSSGVPVLAETSDTSDSLSEAEALVTELSELVDYYTSQEGDTLYAFLNWMASDAYTGDALSDEQREDIEDALYLIETFVDNGYVSLDNCQDAIDLDHVRDSLEKGRAAIMVRLRRHSKLIPGR